MDSLPLPARSQKPCPALDFVTWLNTALSWYQQALKPGEKYRVIFAGAFGIYAALRIGVAADEFLQITIVEDYGKESEVIAHTSQCSVKFEIFVPQTEAEKAEKPFIGFTSAQTKGQP